MRIVAVEEHFTCQDLLSRIDCATLVRNGWPAPGTTMFQARKYRLMNRLVQNLS